MHRWIGSLIIFLALTGCQRDGRTLAPGAVEFETEIEAEVRGEGEAGAAHGVTYIDGPTVITSPGRYQVVSDFTATDDGIVIQSDYVLLDLANHTLTGPGNKLGRGIVLDGASHCIVKRGQLETFGAGVVLMNANHNLIRNLAVQGGDEFADPPNGVPPQIGVMLVNSAENRLSRNGCTLVNLGFFVRGPGSYDNLIRRNTVTGGSNGLLAVCYNPAPGDDPAGPTRDEVSMNVLDRFGTGIQTSAGSSENRFTRNVIRYFNQPWQDFNGTNHFLRNRVMQITP